MTMALLEAVNLTKRYGRVEALRGIDLVAHSGQVLALLGPNGAGKTTFVRLLATLARPDEGHLRVAGLDVVRQDRQVRRVIGLAGQHAAVEPTMTGRENLEMIAQLFGRPRRRSRAAAAEVLARLDLAGTADNRVVILDRGAIAADGSPDELKNRLGGHVVTIRARHRDDLPRLLALTGPAGTVDPELLTVSWTAASGGDEAARAFHELTTAGIPINEITVRRPSLDEVFLHLTEVPA